MANTVTNIIRSSAEVLAALIGEEDIVDFGALIPMTPEAVGITHEYMATSLMDLLTGQVDIAPFEWDQIGKMKLSYMHVLTERGGIAAFKNNAEFENFLKALRYQHDEGCFNRHPVICPSDWAREHWGTKQNTIRSFEIEGGVQFQTVWTPPYPVIEALARRFPSERIDFLWADEDIGSNFGHRIFIDGGFHEVRIDDPIDFALTVTGEDREDYWRCPDTAKWKNRGL